MWRRGIFGIIKDVNAEDDPVIFKDPADPRPGGNFFQRSGWPGQSSLLAGHGRRAARRRAKTIPEIGMTGKRDGEGNAHSPCPQQCPLHDSPVVSGQHRSRLQRQEGVLVEGIIYGGRDSDTSAPIEESPDWESGIIFKACTLESETTSATIGQEGVLAPQPMANLDFISYPIGQYIYEQHPVRGRNQEGSRPSSPSITFSKIKDGQFLTSKMAKKVWLHWAERRVHGEVGALPNPFGLHSPL